VRLVLRVAVAAALVSVSAVAGCGASAPRPRTASARTRTRVTNPCSAAVAQAGVLSSVGSAMVPVAGHPFGVATTADGRWSFVDEWQATGDGRLAVFSDRGRLPRFVRTIALPSPALGNSLTSDGRYLLVADGSYGAVVVSVARAEIGAPGAVLGTLEHAARPVTAIGAIDRAGAIETASSAGGRYVFVSVEFANVIAVYDLGTSLSDDFRSSGYVGSIPLNHSPVGVAISPDGRWVYATSEGPGGGIGTLSVISVARAEHDPPRAVLRTVDAGCNPVRVAVSPNGATVWVTARASDQLLAFSASRLRAGSSHALLAAVRVGEAPVGLALTARGREIVVADSNRFGADGQQAELTIVNAAAALAHRPAVTGTVRAGLFPREMSLDAPARSLLVTNFGSGELEAVNLAKLR
jgi:DNA-binding beta-propeller fold protein YncE